MWPDEIVIAPEDVQLLFQIFTESSEVYSSPGQIGNALTNGEVEPFNEGCVQRLGIFRFEQSFIELYYRSNDSLPLHFDDSIVAASFNDLGVKALSKTTTSSAPIAIKPISNDEWNTLPISL